MSKADIVQRGWDAVGVGEWDKLVADYADNMIFIMPGQTDVLEGKAAFRTALDSFGEIVPAGFEITGMHHIEGDDEVVSIVQWKCNKVGGSQLAILFKFNGELIVEERWFLDTEQWKAAM